MKLDFNITGMTCAACSARVEKVTLAVPGVESAEVNLLASTMTVEIADETAAEKIVKAVTDLMATIQKEMLEKARIRRDSQTFEARNLDEFANIMNTTHVLSPITLIL